MRKKILPTIILILILAQAVSALTAESDSYSIARFGTGILASNLASDNLEAHSILLANAGTRNAEGGDLLVNIGFWGNTPYHTLVSITSYSISPKSAIIGSTIGLYISALNAQSIWAKITSPNNQVQTLTLNNTNFVYYLPSPSVLGKYNVIFYANSSTGATASVVDYFDLTEQTTTPPLSRGGSSGGTTTIIEKTCNYNWDCTPWSICSEQKQKRECKNIGTCNGTESKPKEEINCSEALFDILLKLNDINITQNKTLKFNIDLTEKTGIEKIDIYVKYSVIDDNNIEIFSQIETRAVKGNLTYEKDIDKINLRDGDYILRVDVLYGNLQRAFAEQKFKVGNNKIGIEKPAVGILGRVISNISPVNNTISLIFLIVFFVLILLILLRKKIILVCKKIIEFLSGINNKSKKYSKNSIKSLINKKVYSEGGHYMGKVKDVILGENKIDSLKIKVDRKHNFKAKGIIINYKQVNSVGEVIIISEKVAKYLENYKEI